MIPMHRASLSDLAREPHDVLVVGGGIIGAMTARDAALRGLRTVLIDKGDFGSGVSHNSMKVMHGGIRYVQHLDFGRLRESAREQAFWQRAAPDHIVPLEFLMPLTGIGMKGPLAFGAAAMLYAAMSIGRRGRDYPAPKVLSARAARQRLGQLAPDGLTGGGLWVDGQIRDANRLQIACVAAAAEQGAAVANYVEAAALVCEGDRITGVTARDSLSGDEAEIRATVTISCAGAAAADLARAAIPRIPTDRFPRFARAINLWTPRLAPELGLSLVSRSRSDAVMDRGGRLYFLTPWEGGTIFGTHEALPDTADTPRSVAQDARDFLDELNHACPNLNLTPEEIRYIYAGLIPADVDDDKGQVQRQTRSTLIDHRATDGLDGLISAIGIKYTTARMIGERAIDLAAARIGRPVPSSPSLHTPLPEVADTTVAPDDDTALGHRIRTAIDAEMALTLEDIVVRRCRLAETGALAGAQGGARLDRVARLAGDILGWDCGQIATQTQAVRDVLARHDLQS